MMSRKNDMVVIFNELSEKNKEILLLVAKSIQVAQNTEKQSGQIPRETVLQA